MRYEIFISIAQSHGFQVSRSGPFDFQNYPQAAEDIFNGSILIEKPESNIASFKVNFREMNILQVGELFYDLEVFQEDKKKLVPKAEFDQIISENIFVFCKWLLKMRDLVKFGGKEENETVISLIKKYSQDYNLPIPKELSK